VTDPTIQLSHDVSLIRAASRVDPILRDAVYRVTDALDARAARISALMAERQQIIGQIADERDAALARVAELRSVVDAAVVLRESLPGHWNGACEMAFDEAIDAARSALEGK
jgi:hypothetical protein